MNKTTQNSGLSRKDFLRYILVAAGVSAIGGGAYLYHQREVLNQPLTVESLRHRFSDAQKRFQLIGERYLEKYTQGLSDSVLIQELNEKLSSAHIDTILLSDLSNLVSQQILYDFKESNVVNLEGWILSETEAQICALLSM